MKFALFNRFRRLVSNWRSRNRPYVLCSAARFEWLGVNRRSLAEELRQRGFRLDAFEAEITGNPPEGLKPQRSDPECSPGVNPLWLYPLLCELNLFRDELDLNKRDHMDRCDFWQQHCEALRASAERRLDKGSVLSVATFQGYFPEDAVLRQEAIRRGLRVVNFEITAMKGRLVWDDVSGITTTRNLARNFFWRHEGLLEPESADQYCEEWSASIHQRKNKDHVSPARTFIKTSKRPLLLFLGQVYTDSSLLFGLDGFGNPTDCMSEVIKHCQRSGWDCFVKFHPKEANGRNPVSKEPYDNVTSRTLRNRFPHLLQNLDEKIWLDDTNEWDTYSVIRQADVVVTVNSQAGLEAAVLGRKVLTHRNCFYAGLGFTGCYEDAKSLNELLQRTEPGPALDSNKLRARMFFHIFFSKYCIPATPEAVVSILRARWYTAHE